MATKKPIYKLFPYSRPVKIDFVSKSDVEIIFKSAYILSKHITLYLNILILSAILKKFYSNQI